jgi:hypothetical protein
MSPFYDPLRHYAVPMLPGIPLDTYQLDHLPPESHTLTHKHLLITIHNGRFPDQIHLRTGHDPRLVDDLPDEVQDGRQDNHGVVDEEVLDGPWLEGGVAVCHDDEYHPAESDIAAVGLAPAFVRKGVAVEALGFASPVEGQVGYAHYNVINDTACRNEIDLRSC